MPPPRPSGGWRVDNGGGAPGHDAPHQGRRHHEHAIRGVILSREQDKEQADGEADQAGHPPAALAHCQRRNLVRMALLFHRSVLGT